MSGKPVRAQEVQALFRASAPKRMKYFVGQVADRQQAWALYRDGWVLAESSGGMPVFPLWPAEEFALACASGDWTDHEAVPISLEDLLEELLPQLTQDSLLVGVLQDPDGHGVTVPASVLRGAILAH